MKSKASYFSVSKPLLIENFKRLWSIPALGFLVYFFSGAFPVIMSYKNLNNMASYIEMSLRNMQPFYMMAHLILPVAAAVMLLRYLQSPGSVAVMHAMPLTRGDLFVSNYVTGLLFATLPILANGGILMLLSKPAFNEWSYAASMGSAGENVFSRMAVANWVGTSLLIVAVLYSIAVFAGIVTGNSTMHTLASYYFIFLVPLLYSVFNVYFQKFLFGFDLSGSWMERALMISPYTGILKGNGYFTGREIAFYCVTIVVMTAAAAFLYVRRRLERAGDPLTFEFVKPVISYVAAFLGMTMLGFYFLLLQDSELYMYAGFVAGSILFFIIGTMIVEKSPRVFNRKGYRNFLIYSVVAVLFVLGLRFDVAGFENRVPQASQVEWAQMDMPYSRLMYDGVFRENILRDPENITAVTAFHQSVVDDKIRLKRNTFYGETSSFYIAYSGLGRFVKSRYYSVDYDFYKDSPYLKAIFESKECKDNLSFLHPDVEKYVTLYFYSDRMEHKEYGFEAPVIEDPATVREVVGLLEKDFRAMTYEEFISREPAVVNIEMQFIYSNAARRPMARGNGGYRGFGVPETFINTLEWLQINGYLD